jgi:hypothetical protein
LLTPIDKITHSQGDRTKALVGQAVSMNINNRDSKTKSQSSTFENGSHEDLPDIPLQRIKTGATPLMNLEKGQVGWDSLEDLENPLCDKLPFNFKSFAQSLTLDV